MDGISFHVGLNLTRERLLTALRSQSEETSEVTSQDRRRTYRALEKYESSDLAESSPGGKAGSSALGAMAEIRRTIQILSRRF